MQAAPLPDASVQGVNVDVNEAPAPVCHYQLAPSTHRARA